MVSTFAGVGPPVPPPSQARARDESGGRFGRIDVDVTLPVGGRCRTAVMVPLPVPREGLAFGDGAVGVEVEAGLDGSGPAVVEESRLSVAGGIAAGRLASHSKRGATALVEEL